jgi:hypothetical protein
MSCRWSLLPVHREAGKQHQRRQRRRCDHHIPFRRHFRSCLLMVSLSRLVSTSYMYSVFRYQKKQYVTIAHFSFLATYRVTNTRYLRKETTDAVTVETDLLLTGSYWISKRNRRCPAIQRCAASNFLSVVCIFVFRLLFALLFQKVRRYNNIY